MEPLAIDDINAYIALYMVWRIFRQKSFTRTPYVKLNLLIFCLSILVQLMLEKDRIMEIPAKQKMERQETLAREHIEEYKAALQRAVTLSVPHAYSPSQYGTFDDESEDGENSHKSSGESSVGSSAKNKSKESWNELIERLFDKDESGHMVLKKSHRDN